jgi:nucleotide-binding universal stress UspA family protein
MQMTCHTQQSENPVLFASRHTVLVPVDFSSCSRAALVYASNFISNIKASMLILHVVHDAGDECCNYRKYGGANNVRPMADIAVDMLEAFIGDVKKELTATDELTAARKMVVGGLPASRIHEVAEHENVASIIMGTHGRMGLARLALGSVAEKVLQRSHIPVTVIKNPPADS